jgi:hypothetical protein
MERKELAVESVANAYLALLADRGVDIPVRQCRRRFRAECRGLCKACPN